MKWQLTRANFGITSWYKAFFIKPILPAVRCNFDVIFLRSLYITAIRFGNFLLVNNTPYSNKVKYRNKLLKLYKQKLFRKLFHHQCYLTEFQNL